MGKIKKAFVAFGLPALKTNVPGIAKPVVLYSTGIGAQVACMRCLIFRTGK